MKSKRWLLFLPTMLFVVLIFLPVYSDRISVALSGHPFAIIIPKGMVKDRFRYIQMDGFHIRSFVFSGFNPIGYTEAGMFNFPRFSPFPTVEGKAQIPFDTLTAKSEINPLFDGIFPFLWSKSWWLMLLQLFVLVPIGVLYVSKGNRVNT